MLERLPPLSQEVLLLQDKPRPCLLPRSPRSLPCCYARVKIWGAGSGFQHGEKMRANAEQHTAEASKLTFSEAFLEPCTGHLQTATSCHQQVLRTVFPVSLALNTRLAETLLLRTLACPCNQTQFSSSSSVNFPASSAVGFAQGKG